MLQRYVKALFGRAGISVFGIARTFFILYVFDLNGLGVLAIVESVRMIATSLSAFGIVESYNRAVFEIAGQSKKIEITKFATYSVIRFAFVFAVLLSVVGVCASYFEVWNVPYQVWILASFSLISERVWSIAQVSLLSLFGQTAYIYCQVFYSIVLFVLTLFFCSSGSVYGFYLVNFLAVLILLYRYRFFSLLRLGGGGWRRADSKSEIRNYREKFSDSISIYVLKISSEAWRRGTLLVGAEFLPIGVVGAIGASFDIASKLSIFNQAISTILIRDAVGKVGRGAIQIILFSSLSNFIIAAFFAAGWYLFGDVFFEHEKFASIDEFFYICLLIELGIALTSSLNYTVFIPRKRMSELVVPCVFVRVFAIVVMYLSSSLYGISAVSLLFLCAISGWICFFACLFRSVHVERQS